jgi:hypothetical protein
MLGASQQSQIGSVLAAQITYIAQCDNYDRLGSIFFIVKSKGEAPQPTDPRTEIVRWITPFSDCTQGAIATHVYPSADISRTPRRRPHRSTAPSRSTATRSLAK